jgi:CxxC-x17-CxxC domain-containing protein
MATDKTLTCRDCGQEFIFTAGEQDFYASKGFTNEPSRCPECRSSRKVQRDGGYTSSGGYTSGSSSYSSSSGGYAGGSSSYGITRRGPREMFTVTCSGCGGEARVPFEPRGDKPVYCSSCFEQRQSSGSGGRGRSGGRY